MLKRILGLHSKKRKRREEKKGREKNKCHTRRVGPTSLKKNKKQI
jgi:hypothetical protein